MATHLSKRELIELLADVKQGRLHKTAAAKRASISPSTLYRQLEKNADEVDEVIRRREGSSLEPDGSANQIDRLRNENADLRATIAEMARQQAHSPRLVDRLDRIADRLEKMLDRAEGFVDGLAKAVAKLKR